MIAFLSLFLKDEVLVLLSAEILESYEKAFFFIVSGFDWTLITKLFVLLRFMLTIQWWWLNAMFV